MIAVDATVLADILAGEDALRASAQKLMSDDPDWISVGLWRYELGNTFWKMLKFGGADAARLRFILAGAGRLLVETVDEVERAGVWDLAVATGLTFYDASYVWLARSRGLKLHTRDKQVLRGCPDVAVAMPAV